MSIRTITAPGIQINEIDKSQYSPAMTGSNCYVMGFTDKGEPYQPMEFTSRTAWTNYYGTPDNEAERYAYTAACEVLNQGGRLYFARLPYDNPAFEKVACFKYNVKTGKQLSTNTPFNEIFKADDTIKDIAAIEPTEKPIIYELSAVDEYRTGEATVGNNTFVIADIAFNTYGKIPEDNRKNEKREMVGIMPVITTAANALYAQKLIDVEKENVLGYETIGNIVTLDGTQLSDQFPETAKLVPNRVKDIDLCKPLNTRYHYSEITSIQLLSADTVVLEGDDLTSTDAQIAEKIEAKLNEFGSVYEIDSWNGKFQYISSDINDEGVETSKTYGYSFKANCTSAMLSGESNFAAEYAPRFGWHNLDGDDNVPDTLSREANEFFPTIITVTDANGEIRFDRDHMKKIGVIVYKMFVDPSVNNKINFEPVEAYAGSLCRTDKDSTTGVTTFIDTIINSQSKYINFFSNCFNTPTGKKYYKDELDMLVVQPGGSHKAIYKIGEVATLDNVRTELTNIEEALSLQPGNYITIDEVRVGLNDLSTWLEGIDDSIDEDEALKESKTYLESLQELLNKIDAYDVTTPSLGFYADMTKETISIDKSIYDGINKSFEKVKDINKLDIDIIPDAGLANIAAFLKAIYGNKGEYDLGVTDDMGNSMLGMWRVDSNNAAVKTWKTVEQKFDNFCKNVRKDCMFIADGPRQLVLAGQKKIIRSTKPSNTIDANIIPNLKFITGLNTSYGACYVDWFEIADEYSGDFFWCPPSIKAMGVCINCDVNHNYWDAPAGLNRGVIAATDVAFSPTPKQAGSFYEKNFNYAINYPNDGIVLEGQKTLQVKPSAFDRINVRRLFLRLERVTYQVARYFVYEPNTAYTRQRFIDAINPYFKEAKDNGGIYDYKIRCDEVLNDDTTIDRNELKAAIGIKPVKTSEFLNIDFVALRTGGSWSEAGF